MFMYDTIDKKLLKKFQIIKKIGQGAYGQVWKVKNKKTGVVCALKKICDAFRNEADSQKTYREIKYLQKFDHPNITKLQKFYKSSNEKQVYLSLQYMQADLSIALKNSVLKQIHKHYIFYQMANVLNYLHSADLIHRDIKPSNILINQTCQIKLCDFGLIRSLHKEPHEELVMTENVATRWYRAPQILLCSKVYGKAVDIWSLGCVLAEMVLQRPLFQGTSSLSQLQKIFEVTGRPTSADLVGIKNQAAVRVVRVIQIKQKKSLKSILNTDDSNLLDLLQKIFQINPQKRPTSEQVLSHPFILRFRGRLLQKRALFPIKILYETRLLSVQEYKTLLADQKEEQNESKYKNGQEMTVEQSKNIIYKTVPSELNRNNLFNHLPWSKVDRMSPLHSSNLTYNHVSPKVKKQTTPIKQIIKEEETKRQTSPSFLQHRKKQGQSAKCTPQKKQQHSNMKMKKIQTFPLRSSPVKQSNSLLKLCENKSMDIKTTVKTHQNFKNPQSIKETHFQNMKLQPTISKSKHMLPINKNLPEFNLKQFQNQKVTLKEEKINPQKLTRLVLQRQNKPVFNVTPNKLNILNIDRLKGPMMNKSVSPMNKQNEPTQLSQAMSQKTLVFKQMPRSGIDFDRKRRHHYVAGQIVQMRK